MSVQGEKLKAIADAIRAKKGTSEPIKANDFASEILSITTGIEPSGTIEISENGVYNVTEYASANVNVSGGGGGGQDMLQQMVDQTNSCAYLFYQYGTNTYGFTYNNDFMKNLDTSNVNTMKGMFYYGYFSKLDLSNLNTSKVTNMEQMFLYTNKLSGELDVSSFDTRKVTNMRNMFYNSSCSSIKFGSNFITSNVFGMDSMFAYLSNITSLDLSFFDTSSCSSFYSMFDNSTLLTSLNLSSFNTSKGTNFGSMFQNLSNITSLDLSSFDTSKGTNMSNVFKGCTKLETILGKIDLYKATSISNIVQNCTALTTITLKNIKLALTIGSGTSYGHLLSVDSLVNAVKELWDYSSGTKTYSLTMGTANTAKLADVYVRLITPTAEQIAADPYIESKLPCEVCESTDEGAMLITAYAQQKNWQIS